jgi:hypothetical protein
MKQRALCCLTNGSAAATSTASRGRLHSKVRSRSSRVHSRASL